MARPFKLAMVQILVRGGDKAGNLARAIAGIEKAAREGAEVILLPECLDLGWTHPSARTKAEPSPAFLLYDLQRIGNRRPGHLDEHRPADRGGSVDSLPLARDGRSVNIEWYEQFSL